MKQAYTLRSVTFLVLALAFTAPSVSNAVNCRGLLNTIKSLFGEGTAVAPETLDTLKVQGIVASDEVLKSYLKPYYDIQKDPILEKKDYIYHSYLGTKDGRGQTWRLETRYSDGERAGSWLWPYDEHADPERYRASVKSLFGFLPEILKYGNFRPELVGAFINNYVDILAPFEADDWGNVRIVDFKITTKPGTTNTLVFKTTLSPESSAMLVAHAKRRVPRSMGLLRQFLLNPTTPKLGPHSIALRFHQVEIPFEYRSAFMWELEQFVESLKDSRANK